MCAEPPQRMPEVEDRLTMAPLFCRSITGSTCLQARNRPFRLCSSCASQDSSLISTGPPGADPPTLLTRMSTRPNFCSHAATMPCTAPESVMSQTCVAMPGALDTVSRRNCSLRSTANTFAPSSAKRTAVARPLPQPGPTEPAPATMATRFCNLFMKVKSGRVIHQQGAPLLLRRRDPGEVVDHHAVVGDLLQVRVRPVGAPQC